MDLEIININLLWKRIFHRRLPKHRYFPKNRIYLHKNYLWVFGSCWGFFSQLSYFFVSFITVTLIRFFVLLISFNK